MNELEEIVEDLSKRHEKLFTVEQIRAWAHLLQMKKHDSYEHPPNKPFFKQTTAVKSTLLNQDSMSPGKRIQ